MRDSAGRGGGFDLVVVLEALQSVPEPHASAEQDRDHRDVLEEAGLLRTERSGRYKFHHLDTAPLGEILARWPLTRKDSS